MRAFLRHFGTAPEIAVQAPGRVNLIGEHTDYNDGYALPCAIDRGTVVVGRRRHDREIVVVAADFGAATDRFAIDGPIPQPPAAWARYVRGVALEMRRRGLPLGGAELAVAGDIPGGGLSSSASFELALIHALSRAAGAAPPAPTEAALIGQAAENRFVGCQCGVMDQLASAHGVAGHALRLDCRTLAIEAVPLPEDVAILIVDSRVPRGLVESDYNLRRRQCEEAAARLGVPALRDADSALLAARGAVLPDAVARRARHIVSENERVLAACDALRSGDLARLGRLMAASHRSMRDDFEITVPAIDRLVEILQASIGEAGGARMTGGGFGGCVVALLPHARVAAARSAVEQHYRAPNGEPGRVLVCRAAAGAGSLWDEAGAAPTTIAA